VSSGDVDIDDARRGIAEEVSLQDFAFADETVNGAHRAEKFAHPPFSSSKDRIIPHRLAVPKSQCRNPPAAI
jgi:hypothetical protein